MIQPPLTSYEDFTMKGNKSIPEYIKYEVMKALSFFPELQNTPITFKLSNKTEKNVMRTWFSLSSLLFNKNKRAYIIVISNSFHIQDTEIELIYAPKDVLTGLIGLELAKILDYESMSNYKLLNHFCSYSFSEEFASKMELKANRFARRRMKNYVVATRKFIVDKSRLPKQLIEKVNKMYTSPALIVNFINTHTPS